MSSNFDFLKKTNSELYKIILDAEKLFRDEYFEQVTIQVRKFAEILCKDVLDAENIGNFSFDDMIQKIKDNSFENIRKKEFVDDLYFIKNNGNEAVHTTNSKKTPEIALECLERAFEISILYAHIKNGFDEKLDKTLFSEELLMLEKHTTKNNLKAKYQTAITQERIIKAQKPAKRIKEKISKNKPSKQENIEIVLPNNKNTVATSSNFVKIIFFTLLFFTVLLLCFSIFSKIN